MSIFFGSYRMVLDHKIWPVITKEGGGLVGTVQWWAPDGCYAFRPGQYQVLTPATLKKIAAFCEKETAKFKAKHQKVTFTPAK